MSPLSVVCDYDRILISRTHSRHLAQFNKKTTDIVITRQELNYVINLSAQPYVSVDLYFSSSILFKGLSIIFSR